MRKSVGRHRAVLDFTTAVEDSMREQKLSQKELAKRLGKSASWISQVLRKPPNLTFFTAYNLADALGLDITVSVTPHGKPKTQIGGLYTHAKGLKYVVTGLGNNSNNRDDHQLVVEYISLEGVHQGKKHYRDEVEFHELVKWPDGKMRPRFRLDLTPMQVLQRNS